MAPATGPAAGGTTVEIRGRHLRTTKRVFFGGFRATEVRVEGSRRLTVTAPPHVAGAARVRVITRGGKSKRTSRGVFTYVGSPVASAPTIGSLAPIQGPTAGGTKVTVTGTGLGGATAVKFDGVAATALTIVSDTRLTAVTPSGDDGPADVQVVSPGGTATRAAAFTYSSPAAAVLLQTGLSVFFADTGAFLPVPGAENQTDVQAYDIDATARTYVDLGAGGLRRFDAATGRTATITDANVSALRVAASGLVYYAISTGDAAVTGTWVYDPVTSTAVRFTSEIATSIVASADGKSYGQFPTGLYFYDPAARTRTLVTAGATGQYDATGDGSTVYATIGGVLTRFERNASGGFDSAPVVFNSAPSSINVVSLSVADNGYVYLDLSINGTWLIDRLSKTASRIDARNPVFVTADRSGNGYVDYAGNGGTVRYDLATAAFQVMSTNPNAFFGPDDTDTAGALYMDYNADGLYRFDPATSSLNQPLAGVEISGANAISTVGNR